MASEYKVLGYNDRADILAVIGSRSVMLKGSSREVPDYSAWINDEKTYDDTEVVIVGWYENDELVGVYINKIFTELVGMNVYTRTMFTRPSTGPVSKYDNGFPIGTTEFQNANFAEMEKRGFYTAYDIHADGVGWKPYAENEYCRMHEYDNTVVEIISPGKLSGNLMFRRYLMNREYDVSLKVWHRYLPVERR